MKRLMVLLLLFSPSMQARENPESHYQDIWCGSSGGRQEVVLSDRTRVDCVTYFHVIEFDFADKWGEGVSQALHYGLVSGMRAGLVLIVETPEDNRYVERARAVIEHYNLPLELWVVGD